MNKGDNSVQGRRWNRARNRDRNEARFRIRERIAFTCSDASIHDEKSTDTCHLPHHREIILKDTCRTDADEMIRSTFNLVSNGSASAFSLKRISENYDILSSPLDSTFMSNFKITTLCTSRFGRDYAEAVLFYKHKIRCCSLIEYASLIGEYGVVSALLTGGINPCYLREDGPTRKVGKNEVSKLAMKKLVAELIPTSLAVYVIKSIFMMKMWSVVRSFEDSESSNMNQCPLCYTMTTEPLLTFQAHCKHICCELCMWEIVLQKIDKWIEGNVVRCPTCEVSLDDPSKHSESMYADVNQRLHPSERCELSQKLFHLLPNTARDLKKLPKKAKSKNKVHSQWHNALAPIIGSSQDVRRDKFSRYVDCGAIHHCRACLQAGIDVNFTNEYNQSMLYIACWKNHFDLVELLLSWGADPSIEAAGEMSIFNVASENAHPDVATLIAQHVDKFDSRTLQSRIISFESNHEISKGANHKNPKLTKVIPKDSVHPGAGSCFIDCLLSDGILHFLDELWSTLPVAKDKDIKKKKTNNGIPCSDRYYFCDAEGYFCTMLADHIETVLREDDDSGGVNATIYPHMRFLNYEEKCSALAPHVDLCKKHAITGIRSTHTFILYLSHCEQGGETALLKELSPSGPSAQHEVIAKITPQRGRLLLFPHATPHKGVEVVSVPKLLLRGELLLQ